MLSDDRPCHGEECGSARLARELCFRSDVEEGKVTCDKVMCNSSSLVQDVDLAVQDILCLLVVVCGDITSGSRLDSVKTGRQV